MLFLTNTLQGINYFEFSRQFNVLRKIPLRTYVSNLIRIQLKIHIKQPYPQEHHRNDSTLICTCTSTPAAHYEICRYTEKNIVYNSCRTHPKIPIIKPTVYLIHKVDIRV